MAHLLREVGAAMINDHDFVKGLLIAVPLSLVMWWVIIGFIKMIMDLA